MPTHFSTIGLIINTDEELLELVERVMPSSERFETPLGSYLRWADPSGAELWAQLNAENQLIAVNPHFGGKSKVRVLLTDLLESGTPLDGRYHGWADPEKAEAESSGAYPFLFDAPDAACHSAVVLPGELDVQIAAFAHDVQVFSTPKEFEASQNGEGWHTSKQFIPSGLMGTAENGYRAEAAFTGHVIQSQTRKNQLSGLDFTWCLVTSTGGTFDIVADPELLPKAPTVGAVVTGTFWLSGRIGACAKTQLIASDGWRQRSKTGRG